jgi:signal transduction histidine kinase/ActR/RegA family two-component response regulator
MVPTSPDEPSLPSLPQTFGSRLRSYFSTPTEQQLIEEHRRTVLLRTRVAAVIAAVVIPFTILVYFNIFRPDELPVALTISGGAEIGVLLVVLATKSRLFREHYHVPFFLLVGVVCAGTEAILLQLTGGGGTSTFVFPYFLVLFGIATLFPSRFFWCMASCAMSPISYIASELWVSGHLSPGPASATLILLIDYAFIAAIANRVTTRLFFREAENRFALEVANRQLREMDKAKSDFFANISHDLRSPLTVILGPLAALSADQQSLQPRHVHYLQLALGGAAKLDSMINDLLELARIDAGVGKLRVGRVDLKELLGGLLEASTPYAQSLGLRFHYRAPNTPVIVYVDGDKIERVLMNLVSNACKFSPSGTSITVELNDFPERVEVSVTDQGAGIAPADQARIFGRFSRGKDESHRRTRGAGLGLAVVKEFVELHKGQVSVESELNKGSCFTVMLPKGNESEHSSSDRAHVVRSRAPARLLLPSTLKGMDAPLAPAGAPKILVVEDTDEVRSFLEAELGHEFTLYSAQDGVEALRMIQELDVDLVILDVMLPELDGVEVCRRLRAAPRTGNVPVLMYSARGDVQTRLEAFGAGADDFVHKPFEPRELKARLYAMLRRRGFPSKAAPATSVGRTGVARHDVPH